MNEEDGAPLNGTEPTPALPVPPTPWAAPTPPPGFVPPPPGYGPPGVPMVPGLMPPPKKRRTGLIVTLVLVGILVLCGGGIGAIVALGTAVGSGSVSTGASRGASDSPGPSEAPSPSPSPSPVHDVDSSSRATDPKPLTTTEVFPRNR